MPSKSYLDGHLKRLEDPEYASLFLETVLSEALEDGYMDAFPLALQDVLAAAKNKQGPPSEIDALRQRLYRILSEQEPLTVEFTTSAIKDAGLNLQLRPLAKRGFHRSALVATADPAVVSAVVDGDGVAHHPG